MPVQQFEVKAKENSLSGGTALSTGITVAKGDKLIIKAAEDDTWSGHWDKGLTNANGFVAGQKDGTIFGKFTSPKTGATFPYGSLVGSLDGGKSYFLVGTNFDAPVPQAGTLSLCFWDSNNSDNCGSITVSVDTVPAAVAVPSASPMPTKQFEVKAKEHSVTGGSALNTGVVVAKGDRLIIKAAEDDTWACGALPDLTSNANGLVAGNKYGGVYGNMLSPTTGALLPYGSLVGSLDGGKSYFLVGTQYDTPAQLAGTLTLCYWDGNSEDNTGSVNVSVDVVPTAVVVKVDANINNVSGGVPCNTGVVVNKGDLLTISVPVSQKWSNDPKYPNVCNANGIASTIIDVNGYKFPLCSLVGSLDGGKTFFVVGSKFEKTMAVSGQLSLHFWDTIGANNSGFVTPTISLAKAV